MTSGTCAALVLSLPSGNKTARMRIWRALRRLGCAVLRDGVYLLPATGEHAACLAALEADVRSAGGFAMSLELGLRTPAQLEWVRKQFDRRRDYAALVARIDAGRKSIARLSPPRAETLVKRLHRALGDIVKTDFYPGQAGKQAQDALAELESIIQVHFSPGEPQRALSKIRRLDARAYRGCVWATRRKPWVDRLASAWLIKRFIDRKARFRWIDEPADRPRGAVGFDFDGADFTHIGNQVTFEVLLASFGLDTDPALKRLAATVHFLDVGGKPVADASGLEIILRGARDSARSDDELAEAAAGIFDHVYAAYRSG